MVRKSRGRNLDFILAERKARRRDHLRLALLAACALGLALFMVAQWLEQRNDPAVSPGRVVVLPLDNRTGDAAFDTLGLVASDWITRVLGLYSPQREVVPTTTTLAYLRSARLGRFDLLERAHRLARGTRASIVVWGSFYRTGDSLRFNVEVDDLESTLMMGSVPQISTPASAPMRGVDRLRSAVVGAIVHTESLYQPIRRAVPEWHGYQAYVSGLDDYMQRRYASAARNFSIAAEADSTALPRIWLVDALLGARRFAPADSVGRLLVGARGTRALAARAMRAYARVRSDRSAVHRWSESLALLDPADDFVQYELALDALALGHAFEARRLFSDMHPNFGVLHGHPEYYLHYAAAYHLLGNHNLELRVVRGGVRARTRSLDVRLANCRVRAALGNEADAGAALDALVARDTDTASIFTVGDALDDCAGELDAHGLEAVARRARRLSEQWHARHSSPPVVRDSFYESAYVRLEEARARAARGELGGALEALNEAIYDGLPYYEPGRPMLHAEPAFRRLRNTRGFLRINQTRG